MATKLKAMYHALLNSMIESAEKRAASVIRNRSSWYA